MKIPAFFWKLLGSERAIFKRIAYVEISYLKANVTATKHFSNYKILESKVKESKTTSYKDNIIEKQNF